MTEKGQKTEEVSFKRGEVLPRSVAEKQVELLNDFYDVDFDYLIDRIAQPLRQHTLGMVKSIVRGRLSIERAGARGLTITQIMEGDRKQRFVFNEADTDTQAAADRVEGEDKVYAVLAALSSTDMDTFKKMPRVDKATAEDVGNYFLFV